MKDRETLRGLTQDFVERRNASLKGCYIEIPGWVKNATKDVHIEQNLSIQTQLIHARQ